MSTYWLRLTLESDATFGSGEGVPGLIDQDVALDGDGCPFVNGRTLKGLLNEVCADLLYALKPKDTVWKPAADSLFGVPGSDDTVQGIMSVGRGQLPALLRRAIHDEVVRNEWTRDDVIHALTVVRRQTAVDAKTGVPDPHTLRATRVILRETSFEARLDFARRLEDPEKGWLAACVLGLRRAGVARNRGRGRLVASILDQTGDDVTRSWFTAFFEPEVRP
jgi:hypothetical protein